MGRNIAILAAAGSRKTDYVVEQALAADGPVLITTFTNENQREIARRLEEKAGTIPPNIAVMGWFAFLIAQCAKPYQRILTGDPLTISGLNFKGRRHERAKKTDIAYYLDRHGGMFRDGVSDFVVNINQQAGGVVVRRLERVYRHIFVDEVQDLVGFDLDVLDLLMKSEINVTLVGDPRQHTFSTSIGPRNKKYRGSGMHAWLSGRTAICEVLTRDESYRCNQSICSFADALYPSLPITRSLNADTTSHDGVFFVTRDEVADYVRTYAPVTVLRNDKNVDTLELAAMNIGMSKGRTFDRVLIFPTQPMLNYLRDRDQTKLKAPERLYVAVTRARYSVTFVVPKGWST
ncbi:UvrD-helicase domain-containing protein [Dyella sp. Tek66A03]|uniref:UvrD-helicase domain-containing protein n=1 Tax=Dyella sp. Tek66A03 TaxID=3458298 RepID=UPI00403E802F